MSKLFSDYKGVSPQDTRPSSWVIRNKETGRVVMETYDYRKVEKLNTRIYEAVPIADHLRDLNNRNR